MRPSILQASALLSVLALSCASTDGATPTERAPEASFEVEGAIAHRDPRLGGTPSFVWLNRRGAPSFANAHEAAQKLLPSISRSFGLNVEKSVTVAHVDDRGKGPVIARYKQRIGDLEVFRGGVNVVMTRELQPIAASGFLAPSPRGSERPFVLGSHDALMVAARLVGKTEAFSQAEAKDGYERFSAPGLLAPARVKKTLFPVHGPDGVELEPSYYVELMVRSGPSRAWVFSATDGRKLFENDLVRYDAFTY
ncbi:MAG TPA: hypothetical protein VM580_07745, partial [Labilithrix sp.]|nr:hypothetical protein [Labilithrix sp.]